MRGEIVVDLRAGCSKLVVDSAAALSDEATISSRFNPYGETVPPHRSREQIVAFAFPVSAMDAIDNGPEWASFHGNTDPLTPGGESSELSQGIAIVLAPAVRQSQHEGIDSLCGISQVFAAYAPDGSVNGLAIHPGVCIV